jgi:autophagy-related protein 9
MFWVLVISFFAYIIFKIIAIVDKVRIYQKVKKFYKDELNISENEIKTISWGDIVTRIFNKYNHANFDVYNVAGRITVEDNYLIALFDRNIINVDCLTDLMQWNIRYCIIHSIFNEEQKIHSDFFHSTNKYIMMPFILVFLFFMNFFTYCENLYSKPGTLLNYNWTALANWKLRYYNELYHNFHERLKLAQKPSTEYMNQFPNKIMDSLTQLVVFILSALFSVLVILSLVNENILVNLNIFNKSIIWYITVLGSVAAILRATISDKIVYYPREKMTEIKEKIDCIPEEWVNKANTGAVKNHFSVFYEYKIKTILKNIIYTFLVPFHLWYIYFNVPQIVKFIKDKTVRHPHMGAVCKYSLFDDLDYPNNNVDKKTLASYINFKEIHEQWEHNRYNRV